MQFTTSVKSMDTSFPTVIAAITESIPVSAGTKVSSSSVLSPFLTAPFFLSLSGLFISLRHSAISPAKPFHREHIG